MVARAEDYQWSSARAHCGLRRDPVLSTKTQWLRAFQGIGDWSAWLAEGDDEENLERLRQYASKGLPCGSETFIESLEASAGRPLRDRRRPKVPDKA
jgi:hypothetical protein